ncbi:hypothetical protein K432DRAFT_380867 [Lepidopterella palustris CBS 459.81]|uniref:Cwf18 pre-mRNA splicing factor n=1 Tax=Lepidopterella palustris CBS 459.81 TaxID=1314670 RepID=A0A8E2JGS1_9PEZI|nr:hypothetical protein K432DRAFT_380867 [Lepidopterella palustris CBS 459.81]
MSSHDKLNAAAQDRKARLAQLKSLKRKQPSSTTDDSSASSTALTTTSPEPPSVTTTYLSGRNYDAETRGPKLGFESAPITAPDRTLEAQATALADRTRAEAEAEEKADKPLDLFKLQPKKPNWDLKRDLALKMKVVDVWTENAIARLVRERIENAKRAQAEKGVVSGDGDDVGMEGVTLIEAMHVREREEEEERGREREEDEMDAS